MNERIVYEDTEECSDYMKQRLAELRRDSNIPPRYLTKTSKDVVLRLDSPTFVQAFIQLQRQWAGDQLTATLRDGISIVLHGGIGMGKTLLAVLAAKKMAFHLPSLVPRFVEASAAKALLWDENKGWTAKLSGTRLLIIDDLGKEDDWERKQLCKIISHRYHNLLPTIITTNWQPDTLESKLMAHTWDRLSEYIFLPVYGKSWRSLSKVEQWDVTPNSKETDDSNCVIT